MRRNGKFYSAGFKAPASPRQYADAILTAISLPQYQFHWPVGVDAEDICRWANITGEQWIQMGDDLIDGEYNERFLQYFNVQL